MQTTMGVKAIQCMSGVFTPTSGLVTSQARVETAFDPVVLIRALAQIAIHSKVHVSVRDLDLSVPSTYGSKDLA